MKWSIGGNVVAFLLLLFVAGFIIGGNIGIQADSHTEIDDVVETAAADIAEKGTASPQSSLAASAATVILQHVAAPIAHLMHSLSFVPVVVWRFIGVSILLAAFGIQTYSITRVLKRVRTHG